MCDQDVRQQVPVPCDGCDSTVGDPSARSLALAQKGHWHHGLRQGQLQVTILIQTNTLLVSANAGSLYWPIDKTQCFIPHSLF